METCCVALDGAGGGDGAGDGAGARAGVGDVDGHADADADGDGDGDHADDGDYEDITIVKAAQVTNLSITATFESVTNTAGTPSVSTTTPRLRSDE